MHNGGAKQKEQFTLLPWMVVQCCVKCGEGERGREGGREGGRKGGEGVYLLSLALTSPAPPQLQLKALQTMKSLFQSTHLEARNQFIHALGPEVVKVVEGEGEVAVMIEAVQVLETLLELTPEAHSECV